MPLKPVGGGGPTLHVVREAQHQLRRESAAHLDPVAAGRPVEPEVEPVPFAFVVRQLDLSERREQLDGDRVRIAAHRLRVALPEVADRQQARAGRGVNRDAARGMTGDGAGLSPTLHAVGVVMFVRDAHRRAGPRRRRVPGARRVGDSRRLDRLPRQPQLQRPNAHQRRALVVGAVEIGGGQVGGGRAGLREMAQIAVHGGAGQRTHHHQPVGQRQERLAGVQVHQHRGPQVLGAARIGDRHLRADHQPPRTRFLDPHILHRLRRQRQSAAQRTVPAATAGDRLPRSAPAHLEPLEQAAAAPHGHPQVAIARGHPSGEVRSAHDAGLLTPGQVSGGGRSRGGRAGEPHQAARRQGTAGTAGVQQRPARAPVRPARMHPHLRLFPVRLRRRLRRGTGEAHPRGRFPERAARQGHGEGQRHARWMQRPRSSPLRCCRRARSRSPRSGSSGRLRTRFKLPERSPAPRRMRG